MEDQEHYFSEEPNAESVPSTIPLVLRDLEYELKVDRGVFSPRDIDRGTRLLCNASIPPTGEGDLLDLGCGYGPIAVTLGTRYPDREVWAVDVNTRAIQLTKDNIEALGITNVTTGAIDEVPEEVTFAGIYSNPPIKVGKDVLHGMMRQWLPRMAPGGSAFFVVHKHLGSDSLAKWLAGEGYDVKRILSSSGYRVLRVRHEAFAALQAEADAASNAEKVARAEAKNAGSVTASPSAAADSAGEEKA